MSISAMSPFARQAAGFGEFEATGILGTDKPRRTTTQVNSHFDISLSEEAALPAGTLNASANSATSTPERLSSPTDSPVMQIGDQPITAYSDAAARSPSFPAPMSQTPQNGAATTNLQGAIEALRLVRLLFPGAQLAALSPSAEGGMVSDNGEVREILLPNGSRLNAAIALSAFHQLGSGASSWSDAILQESLGAGSKDRVQGLPNKISNSYLMSTASDEIAKGVPVFEHPSIAAVRQAMINEGLDPNSVKMTYSSEFSWTPDGGRVNNFLTVETDRGRKVNFSAELSLESPSVTVCTVRHMLDGTGGWDQLDQLT